MFGLQMVFLNNHYTGFGTYLQRLCCGDKTWAAANAAALGEEVRKGSGQKVRMKSVGKLVANSVEKHMTVPLMKPAAQMLPVFLYT